MREMSVCEEDVRELSVREDHARETTSLGRKIWKGGRCNREEDVRGRKM